MINVLALMALLFLLNPITFAETCGVNAIFKGVSSDKTPRGAILDKIEESSTEIFGTIGKRIGTDLIDGGIELSIELEGDGNFVFEYSHNIQEIALSQDRVVLYKGKPLTQFRAKPKLPLSVKLFFRGDGTFRVTDQC